jgi:hypothetical protein
MVAALRKPSAQRATKVDKMSRNRILAAGALLWTVAIVDGLAHFVSGDLIAPAVMAVLGILDRLATGSTQPVRRRLNPRRLRCTARRLSRASLTDTASHRST